MEMYCCMQKIWGVGCLMYLCSTEEGAEHWVNKQKNGGDEDDTFYWQKRYVGVSDDLATALYLNSMENL